MIALAKAVPEEKYSWRPGPGVRSVGEVFVHVATANQLLLKLAASAPSKEELGKAIEAQSNLEKQAKSKGQIVQLLVDSFAAVRKSLETATAGALSQDADLFGTKTTRRGILVAINTHIAEHLGQSIAYARMNGITPPWSR